MRPPDTAPIVISRTTEKGRGREGMKKKKIKKEEKKKKRPSRHSKVSFVEALHPVGVQVRPSILRKKNV